MKHEDLGQRSGNGNFSRRRSGTTRGIDGPGSTWGYVGGMDIDVQRISSEADSYFQRNGHLPRSEPDEVLEALEQIHVRQNIHDLLEVGCMDGRRLAAASQLFGCRMSGIDASVQAVQAAHDKFPEISIERGVAPHALERMIGSQDFDVIVLGFFLYLLPRSRLARTAAAVDALLREGGFLVVNDFLSDGAVQKRYAHNASLRTYKFDYSRAWTWNPQYVLTSRTLRAHCNPASPWPRDEDQWVTVDVLHKRPMDLAYRTV